MICLQTDTQFNWLVLSIRFPCIRLWKELIRHPRESFVIFIKDTVSEMAWFSFDAFPNFLH